MKSFKKVIITVLIIAIILGIIGFIMNDFSFKNVFAREDNRVMMSINEDNEVSKLIINAKIDDVEFGLSTDGKLKIEYFDEEEKPIYKYSYSDNTATFECIKKVFFFSFFSHSRSVKVYLPSTNMDVINCYASTGEIEMKNIISPVCVIKVTTGDSTIYDSIIDDITINGSTGKVSIRNSELKKAKVDLSTGNINIKDSKTDDINLKTSTGNIYMDLDNVASEYTITSNVNTGSVTITGENISIRNHENVYWGNGSKKIIANSNTGSILLTFN